MSDERELIAERERKVAELRAAGHNPYANGFRPHTRRATFTSGSKTGQMPETSASGH